MRFIIKECGEKWGKRVNDGIIDTISKARLGGIGGNQGD
jgi:hypothetical protein